MEEGRQQGSERRVAALPCGGGIAIARRALGQRLSFEVQPTHVAAIARGESQ